MLHAKIKDLSFQYKDQDNLLLNHLSVTFNQSSRVGLLGCNGCGKSTLLKILARKIQGYSGDLAEWNKLKIGYLSQQINCTENSLVIDAIWQQHPDLYVLKLKFNLATQKQDSIDWTVLEESTEAGGYEFEANIDKYLPILNLNKNILKQLFSTLSGGEKTKIGLLSVLAFKPDVILLDEPTNHLDSQTIDWFEQFLRSCKIPFLLVSHDRHLLNECVNEIWELKNGILRVFSGNYDFYREQIELELKRQILQFEIQQKKVNQLIRACHQQRQQSCKYENFKPERSVKKNGAICKRDDGSGSTTVNLAKPMQQAVVMENRINRLLNQDSIKKPFIEKKYKLIIPQAQPCVSKSVLVVNGLTKKFLLRELFCNLQIEVSTGERLAILGANGSGKTTLLKCLMDRTYDCIKWSPSAKIQFFSQDQDELSLETTVLHAVWDSNSMDQSEVRIILGSLGLSGDIVDKKIEILSPGERIKVLLAKTVLSGANVLILDEPTNHLELAAREMLEEALIHFQGTVIFTSHDRYFVERVATQTMFLRN